MLISVQTYNQLVDTNEDTLRESEFVHNIIRVEFEVTHNLIRAEFEFAHKTICKYKANV